MSSDHFANAGENWVARVIQCFTKIIEKCEEEYVKFNCHDIELIYFAQELIVIWFVREKN